MALMFFRNSWPIVLYPEASPLSLSFPRRPPLDKDTGANPSRIFECVVYQISHHHGQEQTISTHAQFGKCSKREFDPSLLCQGGKAFYDLKGHFVQIDLGRGEDCLLDVGSREQQEIIDQTSHVGCLGLHNGEFLPIRVDLLECLLIILWLLRLGQGSACHDREKTERGTKLMAGIGGKLALAAHH